MFSKCNTLAGILVMMLCFVSPAIVFAQNEGKDPNKEIDETLKLLDARPVSYETNIKILDACFGLIERQPKHRRMPSVVKRFAEYAEVFERKDESVRTDWFNQSRSRLTREVYRDEIPHEYKVAVMAVDAAFATSEAKVKRSKDAFVSAREKIDELAKEKGNESFLPDREMAFLELLKLMNPQKVEVFAQMLAGHKNKALAERASAELNLIEMRKAPLELAFTAHNGKPFDAAAVRGKKAVYLHFWSINNKGSLDQMEKLADIDSEIDGFVIVGINMDDEADRPAVMEAIKKRKAKWSHMIEGKGKDVPLAARLNIAESGNGALFDAKGTLVAADTKPGQLEKALNRIGLKK